MPGWVGGCGRAGGTEQPWESKACVGALARLRAYARCVARAALLPLAPAP